MIYYGVTAQARQASSTGDDHDPNRGPLIIKISSLTSQKMVKKQQQHDKGEPFRSKYANSKHKSNQKSL